MSLTDILHLPKLDLIMTYSHEETAWITERNW